MKQIRKFTLGRFLSAVLGLFFLFGGVACTRDDASNLQVSKGPQPIKFQVANTSALTKSGDSSPIVEQLTSTFFDVVDGDSLYLSLESTPWEVDVAATKVTPYDDTEEGLNRLTSSSLGLIAYKANNATVGQGGWTYYAGPSEFKYKGTFWEPDVPVIWPNLNKFIRFFAYAPYNDALTMTVDNPHTGKEPTLEGFQVSDNYNTHTDLLIASEVTADSNPLILNGGGAMESYKLTFKHALTAIRFKVLKSANITVNAVRVRGVYDGGILNLHRGWWRGADLTKSGQTISISGAIETIDDGFYQHFAPKYTLMMIPNVSGWASVYTPFEDGAEIEINYTKNETGESKTIITDISKHQWRAGYALTYVIGDYQPSSDQYDYFFSVLTQPTMDYSGKLSDNGRISSYRYPKGTDDTNESLREEMSWTIEGYYTSLAAARDADVSNRITNGAAGTFIKDFLPQVGSGSTSKIAASAEQITISYPGASYTEVETIETGSAKNQIIANAAAKGTENNPWNLANGSQGRVINTSTNTANTYIINGPGYYCFPIVMGNGVKDGVLNSVAYEQTDFVDYKGRAITDPYFRGTVAEEVPTIAWLQWADQKGLIKVVDNTGPIPPGVGSQVRVENYALSYPNLVNGISSTGDGADKVYWVNFHIPTVTRQATATISVNDAEGNTMWTWLIWLTDLELGSGDIEAEYLKNASDPSAGKGNIFFMDRTLGWVDDARKTIYKYPAATPAFVRLVQNESGKVAVVNLRRPRAEVDEQTYTHAPYYQWGRNAPLLPAYNSGELNGGEFYDKRGDTDGYWRRLHTQQGPITLDASIRNPFYFINVADLTLSWLSGNINKLWNADFQPGEYYTDIPVTKTIYDPCPAGYTVPRKNAFTAFRIGVYDDGSGTYSNRVNMKSHDRLRGFYCYTNWRSTTEDEGTGEIYFPFFGRRTARSGAAEGMREGRFHTAEPLTANNSMLMAIYNGGTISPMGNDVKVIGSCIRPQREETPMP